MSNPSTLVDKLWRSHVVADLGHGTALLHLDRIFLHDRTGGRMLQGVHARRDVVHSPGLVFGTFDHVIDTTAGRTDATLFPGGREFIGLYRDEAKRADIPLFEIDDERQGIVHVVAPEQGIALPGLTFVCGDSHTSTVGGIGALAWGIGVSQGEHALVTQTLRQRRPPDMRIRFTGTPGPFVGAKDIALAMIGRFGANGADGHSLEFAGPTIEAMDVAGRMTLCNMAVEFGAWTGIVAPDDATFAFLEGRPYAPAGRDWLRAVEHWRTLRTDEGAAFAIEHSIDVEGMAPQVTWGTSPEHVVAVDATVPDASTSIDASAAKALAYSGLAPGAPIAGVTIDAAFIGSCTNARVEDLRVAAALVKGRRVASGVDARVVPGSTTVKRQAEAEGLADVFRAAGFQWRESGCSLCVFNGGDSFESATRTISTTNRNFENRQGPGVRTHLAGPATVAASALTGRITDPRAFL